MRKITIINDGWSFHKGPMKRGKTPSRPKKDWQTVTLPHTWNALDGQDGGMDYYRDACWYMKTIHVLPGEDEDVYLEFEGVSLCCEVYANGVFVARHTGGFSTFRVYLTPYIRRGKVKIAVMADNRDHADVYPRTADFTFYGGIYRNVKLIVVPKRHFDLDYYGNQGFYVKPVLNDDGTATVTLKAYCTGTTIIDTVRFLVDGEVKEVSHRNAEAVFRLEKPHLWDGRNDPFLYTAEAQLVSAGVVIDRVSARFGVRSFRVDPQKGFFLNGKPYALHGVARHQDRENMGWAITEKEQKEDMELIAEIGANTIRLAHYQHAQAFYDLCDEYGMIVWAEIPFISAFSDTPGARANTVMQMKELVVQNYNHPSIVCWGIANEITIGGASEALMDNLHALNDLCHHLDDTRLTTMANLSMVEMDSPLNHLTDILSYNHYFGWYMGSVEDNGPWLDAFHKQNPDVCLGLSEYGAEGIPAYHSENPKMQDYTEDYQAYYHEQMIKTFATRPFLWSTHVWNMFDFGSDMRDEGGVKGRNNKGLVSFDRKLKKDSFYLYKAAWTKEPFVHLCGKRYHDRAVETTTVKVYSTLPKVTLFVEGKEFAELTGETVFVFEKVPLKQVGETLIEVKADGCSDSMKIQRVTEPNPAYHVPEGGGKNDGKNWFDDLTTEGTEIVVREGYFTLDDKIGDIMKTPDGEKFISEMIAMAGKALNMNINKGMLSMAKGFTVSKVFDMAGSRLPANTKVWVSEQLSQIKKP